MQKFLTIDPGMTTGWAYWGNKTLPEVGEFEISKEYNTLNKKFGYLWAQFDVLLKSKHPLKVYIESVEYYKFSAKSEVSVASGSLFTLAYLIGGYCNLCFENFINFQLIPFKEWGGQLTPKAVQAQVNLLTKKDWGNIPEHVYDAIGMGLYIKGKL